MKRSNFIKKVLSNKFNTVFVNKEQVENALEVFEALGMVPPRNKKAEKFSAKIGQYPDEYTIPVYRWESEDET